MERWHRTLKAEAIRPQTPLSLADAERTVKRFVAEYNERRLIARLATSRRALSWTDMSNRFSKSGIGNWRQHAPPEPSNGNSSGLKKTN